MAHLQMIHCSGQICVFHFPAWADTEDVTFTRSAWTVLCFKPSLYKGPCFSQKRREKDEQLNNNPHVGKKVLTCPPYWLPPEEDGPWHKETNYFYQKGSLRIFERKATFFLCCTMEDYRKAIILLFFVFYVN